MRCPLDESQRNGLLACGSDTTVVADATSFSGNKHANVYAHSGSVIDLSPCRMNKSKSFGVNAKDQGTTIIADNKCEAKSNGQGRSYELEGGHIMWPRAPSRNCCVT